MPGAYEYRCQGRRPATWAGAGLTALLLAAAAWGAAPPVIWALWGGVAALLVWTLATDPVSGVRVDATRLAWFRNAAETAIPLSEIREVEFTSWSRGPDGCRIHLRDGGEADPPGICLPPGATLARVLAARGIDVRQS